MYVSLRTWKSQLRKWTASFLFDDLSAMFYAGDHFQDTIVSIVTNVTYTLHISWRLRKISGSANSSYIVLFVNVNDTQKYLPVNRVNKNQPPQYSSLRGSGFLNFLRRRGYILECRGRGGRREWGSRRLNAILYKVRSGRIRSIHVLESAI